MNFKKNIVYILLSIFSVIFIYNYILPYFFLQNYNNNNAGMGMHMRGGISNNNIYNYNSLGNAIIFAIVILAGLLLLDKIALASKQNKCKRCGLTIESHLWRICPRCGNQLQHREEE